MGSLSQKEIPLFLYPLPFGFHIPSELEPTNISLFDFICQLHKEELECQGETRLCFLKRDTIASQASLHCDNVYTRESDGDTDNYLDDKTPC